MPRAAVRATRRRARATRGLLVTVEGVDGSGKSTFAHGLADALRGRGLDVEETCEPTRTWLGEVVRKALVLDEPPIVDALLFMADHAAHVPRVHALIERGIVVVSDRWSDSTIAYQGAALARSVPRARAWLRAAEAAFDLRPDVTFLLDIPPKEALARIGARAVREKFERATFLATVRANYRALARAEPQRFTVLDARRPTAELVGVATARVLRGRVLPTKAPREPS
ncbi:MAG TPA: dTMP kinase [Candidatus Thermoplasmatota archaeon]|nr:dTMP kinase [Candidatus Thermoplasmatota archaeon]